MDTSGSSQKSSKRPPQPGYFKAYGGFKILFESVFFWAALFITAISYPYWSSKEWWSVVTTVLPTILGFTIAAFALVIGIGTGTFKRQLHRPGKDGKPPLYLKVSGIFVHQIVIQASAIIFSVTLAALWLWPAPTEEPWVAINEYARLVSWAIGFFLFAYSLVLVIAGALNLYTLAKLIQSGMEIEAEKEAQARKKREEQETQARQASPPESAVEPANPPGPQNPAN
ncbi:hypothetical protein [Burkholderia glumae]|uniref:Transmembrane protein n=1 Tax=Burkholderia glumae TaxID=337 RepID=A0ABY5BHB3_BURGL|nr:hypothetical protein [Burkholderia glumae]MCR1770870.1 hypothetical protein [Burkholderia glumae]USS46440.1 hypothetical protein NFI99_16115 [Burkholderia glumae]